MKIRRTKTGVIVYEYERSSDWSWFLKNGACAAPAMAPSLALVPPGQGGEEEGRTEAQLSDGAQLFEDSAS